MPKSIVTLKLTPSDTEFAEVLKCFPEFTCADDVIFYQVLQPVNSVHYSMDIIWKIVRKHKGLIKRLSQNNAARLEIEIYSKSIELLPNALEMPFMAWLPMSITLHR